VDAEPVQIRKLEKSIQISYFRMKSIE